MSAKLFIDRQQNRTLMQIVASIMAIGMAGHAANGQTTNAPPAGAEFRQFDERDATGKHDRCRQTGRGAKPDCARPRRDGLRDQQDQIAAIAMGGNAPFNQVILRRRAWRRIGLGQFARARRTRQSAVPHQRRAVAGRHYWFWTGTGHAFRGQHAAHHRLAAGAIRLPHGGHRGHPHQERRV